MKRSRTAALILMSTTPLLLTACNDDSQREGVYTSVETCTAQTHDAAACQAAYAKAKQDAANNSPQFANKQACEADWGQDKCEQRTDNAGHSFFGPFMTGFFISQMMRNGSAASGFTSAPAFRDANGAWQRPDPGRASGFTGAGASAVRSPAMTTITSAPDSAMTVSRGGFGSRSSSRGG